MAGGLRFLSPAAAPPQARLKYLIHEWGMDKFRSVVEQYMGKKFEPFRPLPDWEFKDYLGWMEQGDGRLSYGVYIQVGVWGGVGGWEARVRARVRAERWIWSDDIRRGRRPPPQHALLVPPTHPFPPPPPLSPRRTAASRARPRRRCAT